MTGYKRMLAVVPAIFAMYLGWLSYICWTDAYDAYRRLQFAVAHEFVRTELAGDVGFGLLLSLFTVILFVVTLGVGFGEAKCPDKR